LKAELSASEARRAVLTAQGFNAMRRHEAVGAPGPLIVNRAHVEPGALQSEMALWISNQ
jgi:uncharacterized protein YcaQ